MAARSGILGLGSRLYPGNMQRIFNKDLTRFMQSLSRECQNRASKRKALLAVCRFKCGHVFYHNKVPCKRPLWDADSLLSAITRSEMTKKKSQNNDMETNKENEAGLCSSNAMWLLAFAFVLQGNLQFVQKLAAGHPTFQNSKALGSLNH